MFCNSVAFSYCNICIVTSEGIISVSIKIIIIILIILIKIMFLLKMLVIMQCY